MRAGRNMWAAGTLVALVATAVFAAADTTEPASPSPTTSAATSQPATVTDDAVVAALRRGVDFLLSKQHDGNWESGEDWFANGQHGGETALVLYALLHAGQSLKDDPVYATRLHYRSREMAPAVEWLTGVTTAETYSASLQACALSMLPPTPEIRAALERDRRFLLTNIGPEGGYSYGPHWPSRPGQPGMRRGRGQVWPGEHVIPLGDLSNAQYAALGMWALEEAGFNATPGYWEKTDAFWRKLQGISGSWPYRPASVMEIGERDSMGFAGIATLYIDQEFVDRQVRLAPRPDEAIDRGLAWLNTTFNPEMGDLYSMYTIERIGLASGLKYFGTRDWYRDLAAGLLAHQKEDGSWLSWGKPGGSQRREAFVGATPITCTCYALLFLARGRNPVLFNKLAYDGPWNARPRDVSMLARVLSKRFERPLNWQVVNLQTDPADWLDAPALVITGSRDPKFTDGDIAKLRTFVEAGGLIFSSADEGSAAFSAAMQRYAGQVVRGEYAWRTLPKNHPLYSSELNTQFTGAPPPLAGVGNGVRELWVHSPTDLGANWQRRNLAAKAQFEVPVAIYFYATGKAPLRQKLQMLTVPEPVAPPPRKSALARIIYPGNWDPEPAAWPRLVKLLRAQGERGIDLEVANVRIADLDAARYPLAHLTGTGAFLLKDADAAALKGYLDGGGVLLADAAGGGGGSDEAFTNAFRGLIATLYPGEEGNLTPLPPGSAVYTGAFKDGEGADVQHIAFRRYGELKLGRKVVDPAIEQADHGHILFSRYDITSGLLGTTTWGIVGYMPESAQKLAENLVRSGLEPRDQPSSGSSQAK